MKKKNIVVAFIIIVLLPIFWSKYFSWINPENENDQKIHIKRMESIKGLQEQFDFEEKWILLYKVEQVKFYVDDNTKRKRDNFVYMIGLDDYENEKKSVKKEIVIDCEKQIMQVLKQQIFSQNMGKGKGENLPIIKEVVGSFNTNGINIFKKKMKKFCM